MLKEQQQKLQILLLGFLDNPPIRCQRELFNKATGMKIVSLAVKKAGGIQKFKVPFKNMSTYLDADIEFAFIRTQHQIDAPIPIGDIKTNGAMEPIDCFSFYCQPNQMKIAADQMQILTIQIKVNAD